jgi:predicted RNA-binding protein YlqC (UPF0109 family)
LPTPEEGVAPAANRTSTVIDHVPATSVAAIVGNDYGKTLKGALDLYRSEPSLKPVVDRIDQALGLLGGTDAALGWIGDAAIVINVADETPEGGVVALPTDPAKAKSFFTSIKSLVALGGAQAGATVREETYNGTTITIIDVGDIAALTGKAGVPTVPGLPGGHVEIAFATTDDLVVIGSGPAFVKHVLDTTKATSSAGTTLPFAGRARRGGFVGHLRRHRGHPRPRRAGPADPRSEGGGQLREERKAVPDPVRCIDRDGLGRKRSDPEHVHHHGQVGAPQRAGTRRNRSSHGSPHPADARRRDQAAYLSSRRRRRPQRPRRARDRDTRPLQPAHGAGHVPGRRRQGEGLAGEGRPAVGHRPPALPSGGHRARGQVGVVTMAAKDLVEYVAKSLVDDPSAVTVEVVEEDGATVIELHVAEDDMGKVIGRNGSVAKALRTLLKVTAARDGEPVQLEIL